MNSPLLDLNDPSLPPDELTVGEYSKRFNVSENTVRTRINRKKLKTIRGIRDGRECILILVEKHNFVDWDYSTEDEEQSETVRELFNEPSRTTHESSSELLAFMERTFDTVQSYSSRIIELSRENERYKLISENSSRSISEIEQSNEQLKNTIFERDAQIRQLELKESSAPFLEKRVNELETQLLELKDELAKYKELDTQRQAELEACKRENEANLAQVKSLTERLESERNKSAIAKLFGR